MPKKFAQQNSKAVEASARKNAAKEAKKLEEDRAREDALWVDDDKHVKRKEERKVRSLLKQFDSSFDYQNTKF